MRKKWIVVVSAIMISAALLWFIPFAISAENKKNKEELFRQVELFSDALAIISTDYVTDVAPKDLIYGALKGMLAGLDPHSQFLDPDTYNELKVDTEGKFGGLGIEITIKDGLITVITPIEDTPAWKIGIKAGDRIVKINNDLTREMSLTDAVKRMRGKPGEPVILTILRESEKNLLEFKIIRDIIKIRDIREARIIEDGIGYLRLVEFRENSSQDLNIAIDNLKKEGITALILDLRNNPGGLLDVAIKVAEKFVPKGKLIVSTRGRKSSQNMEFVSHSSNPILDLPMVVLINEGSASGSEIVAGCLQDYQRAIVVGVKSFGKGSVQTVVPMSDGSAIRLTTSKYFTPRGNQIHGKGVIPDIVVEDGKVELVEKEKKEELKTDKAQQIFEELGKKEPARAVPKQFVYKSDNQLIRAVDILKALRIFKGANSARPSV